MNNGTFLICHTIAARRSCLRAFCYVKIYSLNSGQNTRFVVQ